jgi:hypothetical protein
MVMSVGVISSITYNGMAGVELVTSNNYIIAKKESHYIPSIQ